MPSTARLVASLAATPLDSSRRGGLEIVGPPGYQMLVQRGDGELVVRRLSGSPVGAGAEMARFPAPWPARYGTSTVAPDGSLAVFAGVHEVRAVTPDGTVRWQVRHGCWYGACRTSHLSFDEYAGDRDHRHAESGSAGFSVDGTLVWAHVRGPLPEGKLGADTADEWLLLDAGDGRVLARTDARAAAAGSVHLPHPDPRQMGLSIGEGQDGAPARWGRWDGRNLSVYSFEDQDLALIGLSPSGDLLLSVAHDQDRLAVHRTHDWTVVTEVLAESGVPRHPDAEPDNDEIYRGWDWAGGFLDETTVIAGTVESDEEWGEGRHWLIDLSGEPAPTRVAYPEAVTCPPTAIGDGTWYTVTDAGKTLQVWALD